MVCRETLVAQCDGRAEVASTTAAFAAAMRASTYGRGGGPRRRRLGVGARAIAQRFREVVGGREARLQFEHFRVAGDRAGAVARLVCADGIGPQCGKCGAVDRAVCGAVARLVQCGERSDERFQVVEPAVGERGCVRHAQRRQRPDRARGALRKQRPRRSLHAGQVDQDIGVLSGDRLRRSSVRRCGARAERIRRQRGSRNAERHRVSQASRSSPAIRADRTGIDCVGWHDDDHARVRPRPCGAIGAAGAARRAPFGVAPGGAAAAAVSVPALRGDRRCVRPRPACRVRNIATSATRSAVVRARPSRARAQAPSRAVRGRGASGARAHRAASRVRCSVAAALRAAPAVLPASAQRRAQAHRQRSSDLVAARIGGKSRDANDQPGAHVASERTRSAASRRYRRRGGSLGNPAGARRRVSRAASCQAPTASGRRPSCQSVSPSTK